MKLNPKQIAVLVGWLILIFGMNWIEQGSFLWALITTSLTGIVAITAVMVMQKYL